MSDAPSRRFRIRHCLGRGGYGEVYLAAMVSAAGLETTVAVKLLRVDLDSNRDAARRLRDEARALARLAHPAVLRVLDLTRLDDRIGIITEYVEGDDLTVLLGAHDDGIGVRALLQVIGAIADGLDAAWRAPGLDGAPLHLVHRDIKPANIRLGPHGQPKLLDFGIARFEGSDREARTATGALVGSLPWMAPERFASVEVGPASDVFALGCVLYEGLAGKRLLPEVSLRELTALATDREAWERHTAWRIGDLAHLPDAIATWVESLVTYRPDARPTAAQIARRCAALADHLPGPSVRRWCTGRRWPGPPPVQGSLADGCQLQEETLGLSGADVPDTGEPVVVHACPETFDPSALSEQPSVARRPKKPHTPHTPPAFPSIPLGMALDRAQISRQEVEDALGQPSGDPTEELPWQPSPAPHPSRSSAHRGAPAPLVLRQRPKQGLLPTVVGVAGCMLLSGITATTFAALVAFAIWISTTR